MHILIPRSITLPCNFYIKYVYMYCRNTILERVVMNISLVGAIVVVQLVDEVVDVAL